MDSEFYSGKSHHSLLDSSSTSEETGPSHFDELYSKLANDFIPRLDLIKSVIIPALNEQKEFQLVISKLAQSIPPNPSIEEHNVTTSITPPHSVSSSIERHLDLLNKNVRTLYDYLYIRDRLKKPVKLHFVKEPDSDYIEILIKFNPSDLKL